MAHVTSPCLNVYLVGEMATDVLAFQRQSLENWNLDTPDDKGMGREYIAP